MTEREKIIKGLECCSMPYKPCSKVCPYGKECFEMDGEGITHLCRDALKLLKDQEPMEPGSFMDGHIERFVCKRCGKHLLYTSWEKDNYCSKCGQAVKWDEN